MNDPHVVMLIYRVEHSDSVDYSQAEPLVREEPAFRLEVRDKQARFELKDHYATEADAREVIEKYIRVWKLDTCLEHGPDFFRLKFDRAQIEDRNPTPGVITVNAQAVNIEFKILPASITYKPARYPSPPSDISLDPNVQTMCQRYMGYRRGNEPLASMAYFCLTVLEYSTGKNGGARSEAAKVYRIEKSVLDRIGNLCANGGGPAGARKAKGIAVALTESERRFLEQAVEIIIRRAAEKAHDPAKDLPMISLSDLP